MRNALVLSLLLVAAACGGPPAEQGSAPDQQVVSVNASAAGEGDTGFAASNDSIETGANQGGLLPSPASDPDEMVDCPRVLGLATRDECDRYERVWSSLRTGTSAIEAPPTMTRGETARIAYGITAEKAVPEGATVAGVTPTQPVIALKVGARMLAGLSGEGFRIQPDGLQEKELSLGTAERWEWTVTALDSPRHKLLVNVYVRLPGPRGEQPVFLQSAEVPVLVRVTTGQWLSDLLIAGQDWLAHGTNFLKALAAFILAIGGLCLAIRKLRPDRSPAPPPGPGPPAR
jgi:hypothetical protein